VQAERRDRLVEEFKRRIQSKIQSYVRLPERISGNPEAVFQVSLFANGEIRNVSLVKSSGHAAYDVEVERAILKASPLPLPDEKEAAAVFRGGLVLKFRPFDGAPGPGSR
jgi:colicin import membrane protein